MDATKTLQDMVQSRGMDNVLELLVIVAEREAERFHGHDIKDLTKRWYRCAAAITDCTRKIRATA